MFFIKGQHHQNFCRLFAKSEPCVSTHFKGRGAFPSSRPDSHRDFEPDGVVHVDFRQVPTHFVTDLQFSIGNRPEIERKSIRNRLKSIGIYRKSIRNLSEIVRKSSGNRSEIIRKSFGNRSQKKHKKKKLTKNKTKQNAARMPSGNRPDLTKNQPRFVLLAREIDHLRGFPAIPERSD